MSAGTEETSPLVLVVNDVESARYLITRIVRSAGWRVAEAETGYDALRVAHEIKPDVVVLDVKLPDILGYEVCRRLKASPELVGVPIIQTSATFVSGEGKARGLDAGADAYLTQPFEAIELIAMIRSLLRLRKTEGELRERARSLVAADERKDEFLAMLAHELRNPLSAILVASELLEDGQQDVTQMRRFGAVIGRQARHLGNLVDDLLDVSRITSGKVQLVRKPLDLAALVRVVLESRQSSIAKTGHVVTATIADDEALWVDGDATRLEQILGNLLGNALKYTPPGGHIAIDLERCGTADKRSVKFRIRDDGAGIEGSSLAAVWELFFQVDTSLARSQSGLGIGLTMVRRLVEMHGGSVGVASDGLGKGAEFWFELPAIDAVANAAEAAPSGVAPAPLRLLFVDDNHEACELYGLAFEREGHQVRCVELGKEGLDAALGGQFDVAVLDIGLPDLDGYSLASEIRKRLGERAPFLIALTGYGRPTDRARALAAGFDVHLVKPIDIVAVKRLIDEVAAKKRRREAPRESLIG